MEADLDDAGDGGANVVCHHCETEVASEWLDHCDEKYGGEYICPHCGEEL